MSQRHKIAESIDTLASLINACGQYPAIGKTLARANSALSYLFQSFICQTCHGSGDKILVVSVTPHGTEFDTTLCPVCQGSGVQPDVLDRLEAEEITRPCQNFDGEIKPAQIWKAKDDVSDHDVEAGTLLIVLCSDQDDLWKIGNFWQMGTDKLGGAREFEFDSDTLKLKADYVCSLQEALDGFLPRTKNLQGCTDEHRQG